jgi:serine/threonine protein kinase
MSPEQAEGRAVDTRSDLYSLGATLYHLLAGRPPFGGSTSVAVALAHLKEMPGALELHRDDLPPSLTTIVHRLLAKSPDERYQSPGDLLHAVESAEETEFPGFRRQKSPLAWSDGSAPPDGRFRTGVEDFRERSSHDGARSTDRRASLATNEVRNATLRLQSAMERERFEAEATRRSWLSVAAVAFVALGVGFILGRTPPRRSRLFRLPSR